MSKLIVSCECWYNPETGYHEECPDHAKERLRGDYLGWCSSCDKTFEDPHVIEGRDCCPFCGDYAITQEDDDGE